ncbi:MAG: protein-disulfide reductase DsbD N-terminal domain-containing protein [Casimicrobiaceae bacterium]
MDTSPISPGSTPRPRRRGDARRAVRTIACLVAASALASGAGAVELLPPHEAFALSARAVDARTLEVRFDVAQGYYLYREKLSFAVLPPATLSGTAALPPGKVKHDEFFGDMQTYRGTVDVRLDSVAPAGQAITLVAESQGCADAGVCFPPQRQTLTLLPPARPGTPAPWVAAPIGRPAWLK